jgi:hypothetical protein
MKDLKKIINIDVYGCTVTIILSESLSKKIKTYAKRYNFETPEGNFAALSVTDGNKSYNYILLFDINNLDYDFIAHELFHCTCEILKDRDVNIISNEETGAYLIGHISKEFHKFLKEKNIKLP